MHGSGPSPAVVVELTGNVVDESEPDVFGGQSYVVIEYDQMELKSEIPLDIRRRTEELIAPSLWARLFRKNRIRIHGANAFASCSLITISAPRTTKRVHSSLTLGELTEILDRRQFFVGVTKGYSIVPVRKLIADPVVLRGLSFTDAHSRTGKEIPASEVVVFLCREQTGKWVDFLVNDLGTSLCRLDLSNLGGKTNILRELDFPALANASRCPDAFESMGNCDPEKLRSF